VGRLLEQLRAVWYLPEPLYDWDEAVGALSSNAVEAMAELEHARWCRDRLAAGWRYGEVRDDDARRNDLLVPWQQLSENVREVNRTMVRSRPAILAHAGFRLERDPAREALAQRLHAEYVEARAKRGEDAEHLAAWKDLPEEVRERNRSSIDHIAVKLARIGCQAVPRALGSEGRAVFTPQEIETMAVLEHERWMN